MSLSSHLEAAAQGAPAPDTTPVMQAPARQPPLMAPMRRSNHATRREPIAPRKLAEDQWLTDCTSGRTLGRVLGVRQVGGGSVIRTTKGRVRVSLGFVVRRSRLTDDHSLHDHHVRIDGVPVE